MDDINFKEVYVIMTKKMFKIIEENEGLNYAVSELAEDVYNIYHEDAMIDIAKDLLDKDDIGNCLSILETIYNSDSAVEWYIYDYGYPTPIESIDDVLDYLN